MTLHASKWQLPAGVEVPQNWGELDGKKRGELLREAIYKAYEAAAEQRRSQRIGASWIGKECSRAIWATYRWVDNVPKFNGRMLRLFATGQQQEERLVNDLRRVGAAVYDRNPNDSRKQISVSSHRGHHFGYLDSAAQYVPFATLEWTVAVEMKSHNDKNFAKLQKEGVAQAKPEHYAQLMTYLRESDPAKRGEMVEGLYAAVNKNTDELYFEFVSYDPRYAEALAKKAGYIIDADKPPERIHRDPSFFKCKFCDAAAWCHGGELPPRSCRTCMHSTPIDDGKWACDVHPENRVELTIPMQHAGCPLHRYMVGIVHVAEQVDCDDHGVTYKLANGEYWVDDGKSSLILGGGDDEQ